MIKSFIIDEPIRLDKLLAKRFTDYSRSYFQYLIETGSITRNGKGVKKREIPAIGDEIQIFFSASPELELIPEDIPLEILYEDEDVICINKPVGMVVHPAPGHPTGTFVNALLHHCKSLPPQDLRPGIVHRLDKDTSGVLLAAKTSEAHRKLIEAFSNRKIDKEYLTITVGKPSKESIDAPIGRHRVKRKEMTTIETGRHALTHFEVIDSREGFSFVCAKPVTGRTHQIRVHLKAQNTPVLGDPIYGPEKLNRKLGALRTLLHAHRLSFPHPSTGERVEITAPPPDDFQKWSDYIQKFC